MSIYQNVFLFFTIILYYLAPKQALGSDHVSFEKRNENNCQNQEGKANSSTWLSLYSKDFTDNITAVANVSL